MCKNMFMVFSSYEQLKINYININSHNKMTFPKSKHTSKNTHLLFYCKRTFV